MTNQEISQLLLDKAKLNTEVAMYVVKSQVLKNEIEDLKKEMKKLKIIIEELEG